MPLLFSSVVHRNTPIQEGLNNYIFFGGGYWFLYVIFLIFLIYPIVDKLGNWFKLFLLFTLIIVNNSINISSILCLDQVFFYLPYFIIGNFSAVIYNRKNIESFSRNMGLYCMVFLLVLLASQFISLPLYFSQSIKTICIIGVICIATFFIYIIAKETKDSLFTKMEYLVSLCGKYSLQLYLFNGFLLVILRVLLCSVLHVTNPIVIVAFISVIDITISLLVCVYILPKSNVLSYICGVKPNKQ